METVEGITEDTVQQIEGKFPIELGELIDTGKIFPNMPHNWRKNVYDRLCKLKSLIPSFLTFFKDILVLEEVSQCMRHLVELEKYETFTLALKDAFVSQTGSFTEAYRRLFLFARLRFQDMPVRPRRDPSRLLAKTRPSVAKEATLYDFAQYAKDIGFSNIKINELIQGIQDRRPEPTSARSGDSYSNSGYTTAQFRYGFPDTASFEVDKLHFTFEDLGQIPFIFEDLQSFHILRSVFCSFFIPPDDVGSVLSSNTNARVLSEEEITVEKVTPNHGILLSDMDVVEVTSQEVTMIDSNALKEGGTPQQGRKRRRNSEDAGDMLRKENEHSQPTLRIKCFFPQHAKISQGKLVAIKQYMYSFRPDIIEETLGMLMHSNNTLFKIVRQFEQIQLYSINPYDAIQAAADSGANTIIILPKDTCINDNLLDICGLGVYNMEIQY